MIQPFVSVIVPNFNHAAFLAARFDSILAQTFHDFEIILLDDASMDSSKSILLDYCKHPQVSNLIINSENSGSPYAQWQKGITLARGEWIWIAESDDWAEPSFLETLLASTTKQTSVAFCHSDLAQEGVQFITERTHGGIKIHEGNEFIRSSMIKYPVIINASMAIFRRSFFQKYFLESIPPLRYCQDWLFWIQMCEQGNVVEYTGKLNHFRQHNNKLSPSADRQGLNFIEGSQVWHYLRKNLGCKFTMAQKFHIAFRWLLSTPTFMPGVNTKCIQAMKLYHPDITLLFYWLRPFSVLFRQIYQLLRLNH